MRFRKSITICKGVKLNLSKSGVSATVGVKGLSLNVGRTGVYGTASLPGTGLYERKRLIGPNGTGLLGGLIKNKKEEKNQQVAVGGGKRKIVQPDLGTKKQAVERVDYAQIPFSLALNEDGSVCVLDENGSAIQDERTLRGIRATSAYKEEYAQIMQGYAEKIEGKTDAFTEIHRASAEVEASGADELSVSEIEERIEAWLCEVDLPMEFNVDFEVCDAGNVLMVDLDLPEIETLPLQKIVETPGGAVKTREKTMQEIRKEYAQCAFGLAIYFSSHFFALIAGLDAICISGYTQRRSAKGDVTDAYIYSIQFTRRGFEGVDFDAVSPSQFCMQFKNRCNPQLSGELKAIEPYTLAELDVESLKA